MARQACVGPAPLQAGDAGRGFAQAPRRPPVADRVGGTPLKGSEIDHPARPTAGCPCAAAEGKVASQPVIEQAAVFFRQPRVSLVVVGEGTAPSRRGPPPPPPTASRSVSPATRRSCLDPSAGAGPPAVLRARQARPHAPVRCGRDAGTLGCRRPACSQAAVDGGQVAARGSSGGAMSQYSASALLWAPVSRRYPPAESGRIAAPCSWSVSRFSPIPVHQPRPAHPPRRPAFSSFLDVLYCARRAIFSR